VVERLRLAIQQREGREPREQTQLAHTLGRGVDEEEEQAHRDGREEHERVTPSEPRPMAIGERADDRIGERVERERDRDREPAQRAGQAHHLVVEEEVEGVERDRSAGFCRSADAERDLGSHRQASDPLRRLHYGFVHAILSSVLAGPYAALRRRFHAIQKALVLLRPRTRQ
jgi:hypothetical protein